MEKFIEELKKVFYVMYVSYIERIKLDYQFKSVVGTFFNQWKEGRDYNASPTIKVGEFLTLKQDSLSVH